MSYQPKNTYHANYYSPGVGRYTTEWVKPKEYPKPVYHKAPDYGPVRKVSTYVPPKPIVRPLPLPQAARIPPRPAPPPKKEEWRYPNGETISEQYDRKGRETIAMVERGVPWTAEKLKNAIETSENPFYPTQLRNELFSKYGLFPVWYLPPEEEKKYIDAVKACLVEGKTSKQMFEGFAQSYLDGKMTEEFLTIMATGALSDFDGKTIKQHIAEVKQRRSH